MYRKEVVTFNKNVQFFFSVGYSVVAINHVVEFKEKKQVKTISEVNNNQHLLLFLFISVMWKLQMSVFLKCTLLCTVVFCMLKQLSQCKVFCEVLGHGGRILKVELMLNNFQ